MNKSTKAAAIAALTLTSASAFAWGSGPFGALNEGFADLANEVFGGGNTDFNLSMNGRTHGFGRGYGHTYDRFQGYNGYAPYQPYVPYYGGAYPTEQTAPVASAAPAGPVAPQAPISR